MIILILSIFYALYFLFLYHELSAGKTLPEPIATIFILLSIPYGLIIISGIFWGFTTKPYGEYFSIKNFWLWSRTDMEVLFFFPMCIALVLFYFVVYRLGEIKGISEMKNTMLFRENINKS